MLPLTMIELVREEYLKSSAYRGTLLLEWRLGPSDELAGGEQQPTGRMCHVKRGIFTCVGFTCVGFHLRWLSLATDTTLPTSLFASGRGRARILMHFAPRSEITSDFE